MLLNTSKDICRLSFNYMEEDIQVSPFKFPINSSTQLAIEKTEMVELDNLYSIIQSSL